MKKLGKIDVRFIILFSVLLIAVMAVFVFSEVGTTTVSLRSPSNNGWSTSKTINFSCIPVVAGQNGTILNLSVWTNQTGAWALNQSNTTAPQSTVPYNFTVVLPSDGDYMWNCEVYDNGTYHTMNLTNYTVKIDTVRPSVANPTTNDADSKVRPTDNVNFSATVTDGGSEILYATINGTTYLTAAGGNKYWTVNTTSQFGCPSDGTCTLPLLAVDVATNSNSTEILQLTVDNTAPTIDFAEGTNVTATNASRNWIYINVTASDGSGTGIANVTFYLYMNSTPALLYTNVMGSANRNITYLGLADGLYYYNASANDTVLNVGITPTTRSIRIDTAAPSVTITAPSANQYVKGTATLTATVTDAFSVASVYFNISNGVSYLDAYTAIASGNTWSNTTLDTTLLSDGLHNVTVYATDQLNKLNSSEVRNFYVDNTYLSGLTLNYPADGAILTTGNVNFNWTANDATSANISCNLTLDTVVNQSSVLSNKGSPTNQTIWNILDGFHSWSLSCWDNATNVNTSATRTFTIETTDPVFAMTSPANSSTESYFNMTLQVNESNPAATLCTYNLSNPSTYIIGSILNSSFSVSGNVHNNISAVGLSLGILNGTYNLSINCIDAFSKNVTHVYNLSVLDNTTPTIAVLSATTTGTGTPTVTIVLDATSSEYATCKYGSSSADSVTSSTTYSGSGMHPMTDSGITHTTTLSYTSDDSGTYYVRCRDTNLNTMTTSANVTFSADVTAGSSGGGTTGGGGTSGSGSTSSPIVTRSWSVLGSGTTSFQVLSSAIDITDVTFTLSKSVTNPSITVSKIEASFMTAPALTNVQVYQLLQITKTNINDSALSNVLIKFKVPKSWLFDKQVSADSIVLKRYTTVWIDLSTTKTKEDAVYVYYEATSSGLSYFAIATRQTISQPTTPAENATTPVETPPAEQPPVETPPAEQPPVETPPVVAKGIPAWQIAVVLVIIIVLGVGAYLFYTQKTQESPPQHDEKKKK